MIEWFMFGALGFFLGCLLALMLAPPLWNRAVKLTTRRLEATMPMTLPDIQADKDQQRAGFAIELRKVEVALEKSKEKASRELIEANKRRVEIQLLKEELKGAQSDLQENDNANRVLQQTIKRRLPDLDARLKAAKRALSELETVNAELRNTVASQSEALKIARGTVHNQRTDIDRLRLSLESSSGRGSGKSSGRAVAEAQRLTAELSRTQEELERTQVGAGDIAFLRRELNTLASHIMNIARNQPQQPAARAEDGSATNDDLTPRQEIFGTQHASNGAAADDAHAEPLRGEPLGGEPVMERIEMAVEAAEAYTEDASAEDAHAEDAHAEDAHAGNGHDQYQEDAHAEDTEDDTPQKTTIAQRFAARRAAKRGEKSGGSLTSRLRNLGRGA